MKDVEKICIYIFYIDNNMEGITFERLNLLHQAKVW